MYSNIMKEKQKLYMVKQFTVHCSENSQIQYFSHLNPMYNDISEEWKEACDKIKLMSQPLNLKSFGIQKIERCIPTQFKVVSYMTQTQQHLQKLDKNPDHFSFNRNSSIMPFDKNRVTLGDVEKRELSQNYINANIIEIQGKNIIATQGPLHTTIINFWRMVDEYNVKNIFMLCERIEKQKVKCDLYWPNDIDTPLHTGNYEIKLLEHIDEKHLKKRRFSLTNNEKKTNKEVVQYQILSWPDGDRPLLKCQKTIKALVQTLKNSLKKEELNIVHCSAGVGRTGTLIAMVQIKMLIQTEEHLSIFECVRKLRQQRWSMVYTASQYEYLYDYAEQISLKRFQPEKKSSDESESD